MNPLEAFKSFLGARAPGRFASWITGAALVSATLLGSAPALALQGGEDPTKLPVLIDKRYGNKGRLQGYALFSTPIVGKFTESTGVTGGITYNLTDWLGFGASGGYFFLSNEVDVIDIVRQQGQQTAPLTDLFRMTWHAGGEVIFTPLYGRISFASEYNPAFDLFALVGGGLTGLERNIGPVDGPTVEETSGYVQVGFGTRLHIVEAVAVRFEYRHFLVFEPDIPPSETAGLLPDEVPDAGPLTNVQQIQFGVQVSY